MLRVFATAASYDGVAKYLADLYSPIQPLQEGLLLVTTRKVDGVDLCDVEEVEGGFENTGDKKETGDETTPLDWEESTEVLDGSEELTTM